MSFAQQVMNNNTNQVQRPPSQGNQDPVSFAQHVMRTNTMQVDVEETREKPEKPKKKGIFSRFMKK